MSSKNRVATLQIIISAHSSLSSSPKLTDILGELNRVTAAAKVPKHNGWLLGLLHTTRALDTTLREVVKDKGWLSPKYQSLGGYLNALQNNQIISPSECSQWRQSIVDRRNKYMHSAGAMPTQLETDAILSEMQACVAVVLAKT